MKTVQRITIGMTILLFVASQAFSQTAQPAKTKQNSKNTPTATITTPGKFVDANHDGICDNYQEKVKTGKGANFVDKNGDGVCDNCTGTCKGNGNSRGCGMGYGNRGQGKGNCCGNGSGKMYRHGCRNQNTPAPDPQKPNDNK